MEKRKGTALESKVLNLMVKDLDKHKEEIIVNIPRILA
jgi:hypothetical protein